MSYNRKTAPEFVWVCALIIALVGIIFLFSGCSPKQSMPEDFNGTHWSGQMGASEAYAIIADDHIEITLGDDKSRILYWDGSFTPGDGDVVTSTISDKPFILARGPEKDFTWTGNGLYYEGGWMGQTFKVTLKEVEK